jgi:hypothetical protein
MGREFIVNDIAKSVFQVHGVDAAGQVVKRRQLRRLARASIFPKAAAMPSPLCNNHAGFRAKRTSTSDAPRLRRAPSRQIDL